MQTTKILELLNEGKIEDLKAQLQDEIYQESLKKNPSAKKRYAAMKRYLKTISETRPILTKPCELEFEGEKHHSFTNSYSLVLTKESCGELEMCDMPDKYPDVKRLISYDGEAGVIDFNKVLAEAKSKGYKYTKNAIHNNDYLMLYKGGYFRMALVDITYGILDNGQATDVVFLGKFRPLVIKNELGVGIILPIRRESETYEDEIVIEV